MKVSVLLSFISVRTLEISYIVLKKKGYDVIWRLQRTTSILFFFLLFDIYIFISASITCADRSLGLSIVITHSFIQQVVFLSFIIAPSIILSIGVIGEYYRR